MTSKFIKTTNHEGTCLNKWGKEKERNGKREREREKEEWKWENNEKRKVNCQ